MKRQRLSKSFAYAPTVFKASSLNNTCASHEESFSWISIKTAILELLINGPSINRVIKPHQWGDYNGTVADWANLFLVLSLRIRTQLNSPKKQRFSIEPFLILSLEEEGAIKQSVEDKVHEVSGLLLFAGSLSSLNQMNAAIRKKISSFFSVCSQKSETKKSVSLGQQHLWFIQRNDCRAAAVSSGRLMRDGGRRRLRQIYESSSFMSCPSDGAIISHRHANELQNFSTHNL